MHAPTADNESTIKIDKILLSHMAPQFEYILHNIDSTIILCNIHS